MKPYASVIIPCYNSEKTILKTLKALENQNFEKDFEVIICDDGSKDNTVKVVKDFAKKSKLKIKIFENRHKGPAWQRNFGAKKAKGKIIVFTDSDCIPGKNWLKEMIKPIEKGVAVGVEGTYKTLNKESVIARFGGYEIEKRHERKKKQERIDFIGTFSAAYRRDIFLKFGGFDESFTMASGEDPELSYRIAKAGYKLVFNPKAFVYHPHPDSLKKYLKQQFYRAYWRVLMYRKHPDKMAKDSYTGLEVPLSAIGLFLFVLFGFLSIFEKFFINFSILSLLFFFIINADSIIFMGKKEKKMYFIAPLLIFLRTFAWVIGFCVGMVKVLILQKKGL